jgi:hypothetical protein
LSPPHVLGLSRIDIAHALSIVRMTIYRKSYYSSAETVC